MSETDIVKAAQEHVKITNEEIAKLTAEVEDLRAKNTNLALLLVEALQQGRPLPPTEAYLGVS